jgi:hypothetical protein
MYKLFLFGNLGEGPLLMWKDTIRQKLLTLQVLRLLSLLTYLLTSHNCNSLCVSLNQIEMPSEIHNSTPISLT